MYNELKKFFYFRLILKNENSKRPQNSVFFTRDILAVGFICEMNKPLNKRIEIERFETKTDEN